MKEAGKIDEFGYSVMDRHDYFVRNIEVELLMKLREILVKPYSDNEFYELVEVLKKQYEVKFSRFLDTKILHKFEVAVPFDVFTCLLVDESIESLKMQVVEYFKNMLAESSVVISTVMA